MSDNIAPDNVIAHDMQDHAFWEANGMGRRELAYCSPKAQVMIQKSSGKLLSGPPGAQELRSSCSSQ